MTRRTSLKTALIAAAIGAQSLSLGMSAAHAQSSASASASAQAQAPAEGTVRAEVGKPLQAAQELGQAGKYAEALAKIGEAEAVQNRTPYETYLIDRVRGPIAYGAGNDALAAKSIETSIAYPKIAADEKMRLMALLSNIYFRAKDYPKAIAIAKQYIDAGGADEQPRTILARSYFLTNDYKNAADVLRAQIQANEKAGKPVEEIQYRLYAQTQLRMNDRAGYAETIEKLVAANPSKEYWADLLATLFSKKTFADRLTLDGYRLKLATGNMEEAREYLDMAELATRAGFPSEAKKALEEGFKAGVLGKGADAAKHKRAQDAATKAAADDLKTMAQGEAAAAGKKEGTGLVNLGYAYVTNGQADKGLALMEQGIAKGGLKQPEDAKLHLGVAMIQAGKYAEAIERLKGVQGNDGTGDLARFWTLYAKEHMKK